LIISFTKVCAKIRIFSDIEKYFSNLILRNQKSPIDKIGLEVEINRSAEHLLSV
jgi:hypothetical protein